MQMMLDLTVFTFVFLISIGQSSVSPSYTSLALLLLHTQDAMQLLQVHNQDDLLFSFSIHISLVLLVGDSRFPWPTTASSNCCAYDE